MTEHSVAAPLGVRNPAGYSSRLLAALIDGGLMLAMVHVIGFAYVWLALPTEPAVPTPVTVSMWALPALYVIATGVLGRTLGMMAAGLRITGADGVHVARLRLLGRAALLCGVVAMIVALATWWLWPLLLLAYFLLMLTNPRHQLPHDQLFGTLVVGRATPVASQETLDQVRAQYGDLPTPEAKVLLGDLDELRRRTRGAMHLASVPMLVLGLIALGGAVISWEVVDPFATGMYYWTPAAPLGLAITAWWFGRQERRRGSGTGLRSSLGITLAVTLAALVTFILPIGGLLAGLGFLAIAILQRSRSLAIAAIVFSLVTTAETPFGWISHGLTPNDQDTSFELLYHGSTIVFGVLGLSLVAAAALTFWRERTGA